MRASRRLRLLERTTDVVRFLVPCSLFLVEFVGSTIPCSPFQLRTRNTELQQRRIQQGTKTRNKEPKNESAPRPTCESLYSELVDAQRTRTRPARDLRLRAFGALRLLCRRRLLLGWLAVGLAFVPARHAFASVCGGLRRFFLGRWFGL